MFTMLHIKARLPFINKWTILQFLSMTNLLVPVFDIISNKVWSEFFMTT